MMSAAAIAQADASLARYKAAQRVNPPTVYLGTGHPNLLNDSPVPLFISAAALARYRTCGDRWPIRMGNHWAGDSGAYTALTSDHRNNPWWRDPDDFGGMWTRFVEEVGPPDFIAIQDMPCEPHVLERTGMSAREHGYWSVESYLYLTEQFPFLPWMPVLQGWTPADYDHCADLYERAGVGLTDGRLVGLGSICRRGSDRDIAALVERFTARGMRLHGFGVSIKGLRRIGHLLASTDSQAWSATARLEHIRLPDCTHVHRDGTPSDCRNCFTYALAYRTEMLDAIRFSATTQRRYAKPAPRHTPVVRTLPQLGLFDRELVAA